MMEGANTRERRVSKWHTTYPRAGCFEDVCVVVNAVQHLAREFTVRAPRSADEEIHLNARWRVCTNTQLLLQAANLHSKCSTKFTRPQTLGNSLQQRPPRTAPRAQAHVRVRAKISPPSRSRLLPCCLQEQTIPPALLEDGFRLPTSPPRHPSVLACPPRRKATEHVKRRKALCDAIRKLSFNIRYQYFLRVCALQCS